MSRSGLRSASEGLPKVTDETMMNTNKFSKNVKTTPKKGSPRKKKKSNTNANSNSENNENNDEEKTKEDSTVSASTSSLSSSRSSTTKVTSTCTSTSTTILASSSAATPTFLTTTTSTSTSTSISASTSVATPSTACTPSSASTSTSKSILSTYVNDVNRSQIDKPAPTISLVCSLPLNRISEVIRKLNLTIPKNSIAPKAAPVPSADTQNKSTQNAQEPVKNIQKVDANQKDENKDGKEAPAQAQVQAQAKAQPTQAHTQAKSEAEAQAASVGEANGRRNKKGNENENNGASAGGGVGVGGTSGATPPVVVGVAGISKLLCLYCEKQFTSQKMKLKHMEKFHIESRDRRYSERHTIFLLDDDVSSNGLGNPQTHANCIYCKKTNARSVVGFEHDLDNLFIHMTECHADKYFACKVCRLRFQNKANLKQHNLAQHPPELKEKSSTPSDASSITSSSVPSEGQLPKTNESSEQFTNNNNKTNNNNNNVDNSNNKSGKTVRNTENNSIINVAGDAAVNEPINNNFDPLIKRITNSNNNSQASLASSSSTPSTSSTPLPPSSPSSKSTKSRKQNRQAKDSSKDSEGQSPLNALPPPPPQAAASTKGRNSKSAKSSSTSNETEAIFRVPGRTDVVSYLFDDNFYKEVISNVRNNILYHLDGKLPSSNSDDLSTLITPLPYIPSTLVKSPVRVFENSELHAATSIIGSTAFPTLLTAEQYAGEGLQKARRPHTKNAWKWKWDNVKKVKSILLESGKTIKKPKIPLGGARDLSKLDMWTQLAMRQKNETVIASSTRARDSSSSSTSSEIVEISRVEKLRLNDHLNYVLDKRLLPNIILEQNEQAVIKLENEEFGLPASRLREEDTTRHLLDQNFNDSSFLSFLRLKPNANQADEPRGDQEQNKLILSGEWARPRCYLCMCCGAKFDKLKSLEEHKVFRHSHIMSQHYEVVGRELLAGNLLCHLFIPRRALSRYDSTSPQLETATSFLSWKHQTKSSSSLMQILGDESSDSLQSNCRHGFDRATSEHKSPSLIIEELCDTDSKNTFEMTAPAASPAHSIQSGNSVPHSTTPNPLDGKPKDRELDHKSLSCSKCSRKCTGKLDMYRHMLDCSGDYVWTMTKKRKYRYYCGSKKRRPYNKANFSVIKKKKKLTSEQVPNESKDNKEFEESSMSSPSVKTKTPPRPRPSDAETIKKMLENLPAKRVAKKIFPTDNKAKIQKKAKGKVMAKHKLYTSRVLRMTKSRQFAQASRRINSTISKFPKNRINQKFLQKGRPKNPQTKANESKDPAAAPANSSKTTKTEDTKHNKANSDNETPEKASKSTGKPSENAAVAAKNSKETKNAAPERESTEPAVNEKEPVSGRETGKPSSALSELKTKENPPSAEKANPKPDNIVVMPKPTMMTRRSRKINDCIAMLTGKLEEKMKTVSPVEPAEANKNGLFNELSGDLAHKAAKRKSICRRIIKNAPVPSSTTTDDSLQGPEVKVELEAEIEAQPQPQRNPEPPPVIQKEPKQQNTPIADSAVDPPGGHSTPVATEVRLATQALGKLNDKTSHAGDKQLPANILAPEASKNSLVTAQENLKLPENSLNSLAMPSPLPAVSLASSLSTAQTVTQVPATECSSFLPIPAPPPPPPPVQVNTAASLKSSEISTQPCGTKNFQAQFEREMKTTLNKDKPILGTEQAIIPKPNSVYSLAGLQNIPALPKSIELVPIQKPSVPAPIPKPQITLSKHQTPLPAANHTKMTSKSPLQVPAKMPIKVPTTVANTVPPQAHPSKLTSQMQSLPMQTQVSTTVQKPQLQSVIPTNQLPAAIPPTPFPSAQKPANQLPVAVPTHPKSSVNVPIQLPATVTPAQNHPSPLPSLNKPAQLPAAAHPNTLPHSLIQPVQMSTAVPPAHLPSLLTQAQFPAAAAPPAHLPSLVTQAQMPASLSVIPTQAPGAVPSHLQGAITPQLQAAIAPQLQGSMPTILSSPLLMTGMPVGMGSTVTSMLASGLAGLNPAAVSSLLPSAMNLILASPNKNQYGLAPIHSSLVASSPHNPMPEDLSCNHSMEPLNLSSSNKNSATDLSNKSRSSIVGGRQTLGGADADSFPFDDMLPLDLSKKSTKKPEATTHKSYQNPSDIVHNLSKDSNISSNSAIPYLSDSNLSKHFYSNLELLKIPQVRNPVHQTPLEAPFLGASLAKNVQKKPPLTSTPITKITLEEVFNAGPSSFIESLTASGANTQSVASSLPAKPISNVQSTANISQTFQLVQSMQSISTSIQTANALHSKETPPTIQAVNALQSAATSIPSHTANSALQNTTTPFLPIQPNQSLQSTPAPLPIQAVTAVQTTTSPQQSQVSQTEQTSAPSLPIHAANVLQSTGAAAVLPTQATQTLQSTATPLLTQAVNTAQPMATPLLTQTGNALQSTSIPLAIQGNQNLPTTSASMAILLTSQPPVIVAQSTPTILTSVSQPAELMTTTTVTSCFSTPASTASTAIALKDSNKKEAANKNKNPLKMDDEVISHIDDAINSVINAVKASIQEEEEKNSELLAAEKADNFLNSTFPPANKTQMPAMPVLAMSQIVTMPPRRTMRSKTIDCRSFMSQLSHSPSPQESNTTPPTNWKAVPYERSLSEERSTKSCQLEEKEKQPSVIYPDIEDISNDETPPSESTQSTASANTRQEIHKDNLSQRFASSGFDFLINPPKGATTCVVPDSSPETAKDKDRTTDLELMSGKPSNKETEVLKEPTEDETPTPKSEQPKTITESLLSDQPVPQLDSSKPKETVAPARESKSPMKQSTVEKGNLEENVDIAETKDPLEKPEVREKFKDKVSEIPEEEKEPLEAQPLPMPIAMPSQSKTSNKIEPIDCKASSSTQALPPKATVKEPLLLANPLYVETAPAEDKANSSSAEDGNELAKELDPDRPLDNLSESPKKQRRRRKNELAAIVADQLLESFKIDSARRDNLKKLENLAYEKSEDLLLTGMLLMSSTKRSAAEKSLTTTADSLKSKPKASAEEEKTQKADKKTPMKTEAKKEESVTKSSKRSYKRRGRPLDNENMSKLKSSLESFSLGIETKLSEYEAKKAKQNKNKNKEKEKEKEEEKDKSTKAAEPTKSGASTGNFKETATTATSSSILRPSLLSATYESLGQLTKSNVESLFNPKVKETTSMANVPLSAILPQTPVSAASLVSSYLESTRYETPSNIFSGNHLPCNSSLGLMKPSEIFTPMSHFDNQPLEMPRAREMPADLSETLPPSIDHSKQILANSRDPRLNRNMHKPETGSPGLPNKPEAGHLLLSGLDDRCQFRTIDEIADFEEDNYLTEIAKNVNEKIMAAENDEDFISNDGFDLAHELDLNADHLNDDSNSKFYSRPPTSLSVRSAPNFNDDQSNFGSMCDDNTNTEVMDMDLDDDISVYTSYSQDLGRRGTGRGRKRRRRRSILYKRRSKKQSAKEKGSQESQKFECVLCKKVFYSLNSLTKHNMTLAHVSKVSEQEYLQSKIIQESQNNNTNNVNVNVNTNTTTHIDTQTNMNVNLNVSLNNNNNNNISDHGIANKIVKEKEPPIVVTSTPVRASRPPSPIPTPKPKPLPAPVVVPVPVPTPATATALPTPTLVIPPAIVFAENKAKPGIKGIENNREMEKENAKAKAKEKEKDKEKDKEREKEKPKEKGKDRFSKLLDVVSPIDLMTSQLQSKCDDIEQIEPSNLNITSGITNLVNADSSVPISLNPDERLFFECCTILKGTETSKNDICSVPSFSVYNTMPNRGSLNSILDLDEAGLSRGNLMTDHRRDRDHNIEGKRNATPGNKQHGVAAVTATENVFKNPIDQQLNNGGKPYNFSMVNEFQRISPPSYSAVSQSAVTNQTMSRFKTKAAMKGYENVMNMDLTIQKEHETKSINCKLTELADIALNNEKTIAESQHHHHHQQQDQQHHNQQQPHQQLQHQKPHNSEHLFASNNNHHQGSAKEPGKDTYYYRCDETDLADKHKLPILSSRERPKNGETQDSTSSKTIMHSSIIKAAVKEHTDVPQQKIVIPDRPFKNIGLEEKEFITFQKPKVAPINLLTDDNSISTGSYSDRDDYDFGTLSCDEEETNMKLNNDKIIRNNSSMSTVSSSDSSSRATAKTFENKSLIMGRIFKNAQSAKPRTTAIKVKSVGVQKDQVPPPAPLPAPPKADLNQLFDELRGGPPGTHEEVRTRTVQLAPVMEQVFQPIPPLPLSTATIPSSTPIAKVNPLPIVPKEDPKLAKAAKKAKQSKRKPQASAAAVPAPQTSRKPRNDISKLQAELGMSPDEIEKLIDDGQRKSKRRCATNSQRKLVEMWSSDEYEEFLSTKDIIALIEEKEQKEKQRKRKTSINTTTSLASDSKERDYPVASSLKDLNKTKTHAIASQPYQKEVRSNEKLSYDNRDKWEVTKQNNTKCNLTKTTNTSNNEAFGRSAKSAKQAEVSESESNNEDDDEEEDYVPKKRSKTSGKSSKSSKTSGSKSKSSKVKQQQIQSLPDFNDSNSTTNVMESVQILKNKKKSKKSNDEGKKSSKSASSRSSKNKTDTKGSGSKASKRSKASNDIRIPKQAYRSPTPDNSLHQSLSPFPANNKKRKASNGPNGSSGSTGLSISHPSGVKKPKKHKQQHQQQQPTSSKSINAIEPKVMAMSTATTTTNMGIYDGQSKAKSKSTKKSQAKEQSSRKKRPAAEKLYYWSSSSDDEDFGRLNNASHAEDYDDDDGDDDDDDDNDDGDDDDVDEDRDRDIDNDRDRDGAAGGANGSSGGEHYQKHGWIVGDSHKKLVTLLAIAKGNKKVDNCGVKKATPKKK